MLSALHQTERKAVGPDGVPVELFNGDPALRQRLLDIVVGIWRGEDVPQQWRYAIIKVLHKKSTGQSTASTGVFRGWRTPARYG